VPDALKPDQPALALKAAARHAGKRLAGAAAERDHFADVLRANATYASNFTRRARDGRAARGLAVLTCIDSRIDPLAMLGLESGDAKILRNAGARVTDDVLTTLVIARYLLGVGRLMVIAHTDCRMVAASEDEIHRAIRDAGGPETSDLSFPTSADPAVSLSADVERVRSFRRLETLWVGGFVYDVTTGRLTQIC
jgi:carbonic anhydrase